MKKGMKFYQDTKFWVWVIGFILFWLAVYFGWLEYLEKNPNGSFF